MQLPYRFPIIPETHSCDDEACLRNNETYIIHAAQVAQYAQAGYACDDCTKRQPCAFNEVKECCKRSYTFVASCPSNRSLRESHREASCNALDERCVW